MRSLSSRQSSIFEVLHYVYLSIHTQSSENDWLETEQLTVYWFPISPEGPEAKALDYENYKKISNTSLSHNQVHIASFREPPLT